MQNSKVLKIILGLCGLLMLIPGIMALVNPIGFVSRNGADIMGDLVLLNDYRGTGGIMLASAIVMLLGIFHSRMAFTSTVVAIAAHFSIAFGRLISLAMDGMPVKGQIAAMVVEFVLAGLAIFALTKYREKE